MSTNCKIIIVIYTILMLNLKKHWLFFFLTGSTDLTDQPKERKTRGNSVIAKCKTLWQSVIIYLLPSLRSTHLIGQITWNPENHKDSHVYSVCAAVQALILLTFTVFEFFDCHNLICLLQQRNQVSIFLKCICRNISQLKKALPG